MERDTLPSHCRCQPDSIRHADYPRKPGCLKCARIARPPEPNPDLEPEAQLVHHCARCRADVFSGEPSGMLYLIHDGGRTERAARFCQRCIEVIFESAVSYKTPEEVEAEYLHAA